MSQVEHGGVFILPTPEVPPATQVITHKKLDSDQTAPADLLYIGQSGLADALFEPAIMQTYVQTGHVFLGVNTDDYEGGQYDNLTVRE